MAAGGSYKQQCPSCEAMVLIKDPKMVGKKIDCPQCKYRFVVEKPAGGAEDEANGAPPAKGAPAAKSAAAKGKGDQAVTAKKPAGAPTAPQLKKKPAAKPSLDEDDEAPAAVEKEPSGSRVMLMMIGISVFAVALLGVGGYFLFFKEPEQTPTTGPVAVKKQAAKEVSKGVPAAKPGLEATNLLPNDTQVVINFAFKDLRDSTAGKAAFESPGAFTYEGVEKQLGINPKDIDHVLVGLNRGNKPWTFTIIRTNKALNVKGLTEALSLQKATAIKGQDWYTTEVNDWFAGLERTVPGAVADEKAAAEAKKRPLALHLVDTQTLVLADNEIMRAFLELEGKPELKTQAAAGPAGKRYLTVDPALKQALDRAESKPPLISVGWTKDALPLDAIKQQLKQAAVANVLKAWGLAANKVADNLDQVSAGGLAVQFKDAMQVVLAVLNKDEQGARFWDNSLKDVLGSAPAAAALKQANVGVNGVANVGAPNPNVSIKIDPVVQAAVWMADLDVKPNAQKIGEAVEEVLRPVFVQFRTMGEMAGGQDHIKDLASAVRQMTTKLGGFPRGTANRNLPAGRTRPYDPIDRVSWMAELLPFRGDWGTLYPILDMNASWRDARNAEMGAIPVPAFLAPLSATYPQSSWWKLVRTPAGVQRLATTDFVGIAGVGMDAAEYDSKDPRAGVFGYSRETPLAAITDGAANTIAILQVPPTFKRPWLAGGGATVMGVPNYDDEEEQKKKDPKAPVKKCIEPFVCAKHGGVEGTFAIMANGDVRFIPKTISNNDFKALCTIHGGEKVVINNVTVSIHVAGEAVLKAKE